MRILTLTSTIFFTILGFNITCTAWIEAADLGKIMPLGDSITLGVGSSDTAGYRQPLCELLTKAGHDFELVGSLTTYQGNLPAGQTHHEGHSGYVISAGKSGRGGIVDHIKTWLGPSGVTPDIILLMIGSNDIDINYECATAPDRLSSLISVISDKETGLAPDTQLIVAQIIPHANPTTNARAIAFNLSMTTVVKSHRDLGENVSLVDMHSALNDKEDLADIIHPNKSGYEKMAQVWVDGIQATTVPEPSTTAIAIPGFLLSLLWGVWQRRNHVPNKNL